MRKASILLLALGLLLVLGPTSSMAGDEPYAYEWNFDDDGDGIPNCEDDDYVPPEDGDGHKLKNKISAPFVTFELLKSYYKKIVVTADRVISKKNLISKR